MKLGFYWDDWPIVWVYNSMGTEGIIRYFAGDRPFAAWIYSLMAPYLGFSPVGWHVAALTLRCLSSIFLFFTFSALWPERKDQAWLISVLTLLYPGFSQQPIAVTYIPQHVSFLLFSVSLVATVYAIRLRRGYLPLTILSLITALLGYLIIEYFIGLELMRFMIIMLSLSDDAEKRITFRIREALAKWGAYVIVVLSYFIWRFIFFNVTSYYGVNKYTDTKYLMSHIRANPIPEIMDRFIVAIKNIWLATICVWTRVLNLEFLDFYNKSVWVSWSIGLTVVVIAALVLKYTRIPNRETGKSAFKGSEDRAARSALIIGLLSLGLAGLALIPSNLLISYNLSFCDRYTLPFMLPCSLVLVGGLLCMRLKNAKKIFLFSVIIFLFSSFHVINGNLYRRDWLAQKSIFWQFAWRIPTLKPGTGVYVDGLPPSLSSNHAAGLLNMLYNKSNSSGRLEYFLFDLDWLNKGAQKAWSDGSEVLSFKPGKNIVGPLRSFEFRSITSQSLVLWISPSGTLRFVDKAHADEVPGLPPNLRSIVHLSSLEKVVRKKDGLPDGPLLKVFGSEPRHEWSYYYQRAELERQFANWLEITRMGDEIIDMKYKPQDSSEWITFIEGYAMAHRYDRAINLTERILEEKPAVFLALSHVWSRILRSEAMESQHAERVRDALREKLELP